MKDELNGNEVEHLQLKQQKGNKDKRIKKIIQDRRKQIMCESNLENLIKLT